MKLFPEIKGKGTYATAARADMRAEVIISEYGIDFRYLVMATVDGRFAPVIVLNRDQQHLAGSLAYHGICITF